MTYVEKQLTYLRVLPLRRLRLGWSLWVITSAQVWNPYVGKSIHTIHDGELSGFRYGSTPLENLQKLKTYDSEYPISEWQSWMDYGLSKFEPLKALEHSSLNLFIGVLRGSRLWSIFCDMTLIFEVQICSFLVFMVFLSKSTLHPPKRAKPAAQGHSAPIVGIEVLGASSNQAGRAQGPRDCVFPLSHLAMDMLIYILGIQWPIEFEWTLQTHILVAGVCLFGA